MTVVDLGFILRNVIICPPFRGSVFTEQNMAIERQQVEQLARLARIALDESTLARTTSSLGDVLTLIDQLQAVDTSSVEPMAHPLDAIQRLRLDVVTEPDQRTALQANAPAVQDGLFLVPKVIE